VNPRFSYPNLFRLRLSLRDFVQVASTLGLNDLRVKSTCEFPALWLERTIDKVCCDGLTIAIDHDKWTDEINRRVNWTLEWGKFRGDIKPSDVNMQGSALGSRDNNQSIRIQIHWPEHRSSCMSQIVWVARHIRSPSPSPNRSHCNSISK